MCNTHPVGHVCNHLVRSPHPCVDACACSSTPIQPCTVFNHPASGNVCNAGSLCTTPTGRVCNIHPPASRVYSTRSFISCVRHSRPPQYTSASSYVLLQPPVRVPTFCVCNIPARSSRVSCVRHCRHSYAHTLPPVVGVYMRSPPQSYATLSPTILPYATQQPRSPCI